MVTDTRAEVIVVGGGPAGSSTATHLARAGVDVLLLDKARFPRDKACAEYCSPGVVDALEDLGALQTIQAGESRMLPAMRIVAGGREIPLNFARDREGGNLGLGVKRSVLDQALLRYAEAHGVRVRQATRVTGPVVEGSRVTGVGIKGSNGERQIRCDFVVAADGLHSTVARQLGLDRHVRWPRRLGLVARYEHDGQIEQTGQMHVDDDIYCGVSPVNETEVNVSLVVPMGTKRHGTDTGDFFEQTIARIPRVARQLRTARRVTRVRGIGPMGKRVRATSGEGFLLVGDAAGFFDPLTGEGVHRALRGGELAAEAIVRALRRQDRFPAGYDDARTDAFQDKERVCRIIQALILSGRAVRYASRRAASREDVLRVLTGVLGDYAPAQEALAPRFIWDLFQP